LCAVRDMANRLLDQINAKTRYLEDVDAAESEGKYLDVYTYQVLTVTEYTYQVLTVTEYIADV